MICLVRVGKNAVLQLINCLSKLFYFINILGVYRCIFYKSDFWVCENLEALYAYWMFVSNSMFYLLHSTSYRQNHYLSACLLESNLVPVEIFWPGTDCRFRFEYSINLVMFPLFLQEDRAYPTDSSSQFQKSGLSISSLIIPTSPTPVSQVLCCLFKFCYSPLWPINQQDAQDKFSHAMSIL